MHAEHVTFRGELLFVVRTPAAGRALQVRSREISNRLNALVESLDASAAAPRVLLAPAAEMAVLLIDPGDDSGVQLLTTVYAEDAAVAAERGDQPATVMGIAEQWRVAVERALRDAFPTGAR